MHHRLIHDLRNLLNPNNKERIVVYIVCLTLSAFLWLLNSLEKSYTSHISVPVEYINFPENKKLARPLPRKLEMMVDASGFTILQYKFRLIFSPLRVDVAELTNHALVNKFISRYSVATNNHKETFAYYDRNEMQILSIWPDSLFFDMSYLAERKVKVKPRVKLSFSKDFALKRAPFTIPDSVLVHAPVNVLDTLNFIYTERYEYQDISDSLIREVKLDIPRGLSTRMKKVILNIPVEQYTEASFEIPVNIIDVPDSIQIKTFPGKVKISCLVGLSEYAKIDKNNFKAYITYDDKILSMSKLPVKLSPVPESVLSADYSPKEVEYVIEMKND